MNIGFLRGHVAQLTKALSGHTYHYRRKGPGPRAGGSSGNNRLRIQNLFVKIIQY